jgi:hypothetical protein
METKTFRQLPYGSTSVKILRPNGTAMPCWNLISQDWILPLGESFSTTFSKFRLSNESRIFWNNFQNG